VAAPLDFTFQQASPTGVAANDQVLTAVCAQLQRMAKRRKTSSTSRTGQTNAKSMDTRQTIEEFGKKVANSPGFQGVMNRTVEVCHANRSVDPAHAQPSRLTAMCRPPEPSARLRRTRLRTIRPSSR